MRAIILTANGVEDSEFFCPYYRFLEEGVDVDVAAPRPGNITGKNGYSFAANLSFADVDTDDYDLLFIPGGQAPEKVRVANQALEVTRKMMRSGRIVAAICHGPQVLLSAGVISGKHLTCWPALRDDMIAAGANYLDQEVVADGNLITSRMPEDLPAFCREVMKGVRQPQASSAFWGER